MSARRIGVAAAMCAACCGGASATTAQSDAPRDFGELDGVVRQELDRTGAPGAALAIVDRGGTVLEKGYGVASVETGSAVGPDTLFQIGSLTKAFTAAALVTASLDGTLKLDEPVGRLLPGLLPCLAAPTLGQLLSHVGGLIDEPAEFGPQGEEGLSAYPRTWTLEYCLLPPGRAFSYSNSGYALAGLALQQRAGRPFADVMRTLVLDPLGMVRTTFRPTEAMSWPVALGHRRKEGRTTVVRPVPNDARLWPAGTLYSSAREMARFLAALVNDGRLEGRQALPAAAVRAITAAHARIPTLDRSYGYGLELDQFGGYERVSHGGSMTGSAALMALLPERRIGVVVLANGDAAFLSKVVERALEIAMAGAPARSVGSPASSKPSAYWVAAERLDGYVGTFANPRRFTVEVVRRGDGLVLRRFGREFPMRPLEPGVFRVERPGGGDETIVFGAGADGRAEYLQMNVWALARLRR